MIQALLRLVERLRQSRWLYRRMAWKNDPGLWAGMHPRAAQLLDRLYESSWPLRRWAGDFMQAVRDHAKEQAIRDVYGVTGEVKHWKYGGSAADIYAQASRRGGR